MSPNPDELPFINPNLERRVCLITGGNSGIGWFTCLHLYMHGYVVYMGGRSKARSLRAINDIKQEAKRRRLSKKQLSRKWLGELRFIEIDLLSLASVSAAVKEFKTKEKVLHLLINNAGVMAIPFEISGDGFEVQLQTNYVAPFLLSQRLLPMMENSSHPRIIYLTSIGHRFILYPFTLESVFDWYPDFLFTWLRYGLSKTAGIHYMKSLAAYSPNTLCMAVHPGFVMSTNLFSHWTRLPFIGLFFWIFFQIFGWVFGVSNEKGCYSTLKCALDNTLTAEKENGKYFSTYGVEARPSRLAESEKYAASNWAWTVQQLLKRGYKTRNGQSIY